MGSFNYQLVPDAEERGWIIEKTRDLLARVGWEPYLLWPVIEPTRKMFPERWLGNLQNAHIVTQRIMQHARLDLPFVLHGIVPVPDGDAAGSVDDDSWDRGTAGWYAGELDGFLQFGVHPEQVPHAESAAGVMAHEVAHAYRDHHGLIVESREEEELLTDLTTIVLGFGILTTNNTDRYRSSGTWSETRWSFSQIGYLPPQGMAFALAVQTVARGRSKEVGAIRKHLEPNQKAAFMAAMHVIHKEHSELLQLLGSPPRNVWDSRPIMMVTPVIEEPPEVSPDDSEEHLRWNEKTNVYRLFELGGLIIAPFAALPGWALGVLLAGTFLHESEPLYDFMVFACTVAPVVWTLTRFRYYVCSDSECRAPLRRSDKLCYRCGGTIVGLATRKRVDRERLEERLEDLERWADESGYEECNACQPEQPCPKHDLDTP